MRTKREPYGPHPRQYGEWWLPPQDRPPLVVLVHGGYWRPTYDLHLEDDVAADLADRGFAVWNIDYRPAGEPWPATLEDVASAYDHAVSSPRVDPARVDPARVAVVGHSAGGHLALWLAARRAPALVVPQAPVACLALAWEQRLGDGAVDLFVGGSPDEFPSRYAEADPLALLPLATPCVIVHGVDDEVVPMTQSSTFADASGCGLVRVAGGHFEHLDPASAAIAALHSALSGL